MPSIVSTLDVSNEIKFTSFKELHFSNINAIFFKFFEEKLDKSMLVSLLHPENIEFMLTASLGLKLDRSKDERWSQL